MGVKVTNWYAADDFRKSNWEREEEYARTVRDVLQDYRDGGGETRENKTDKRQKEGRKEGRIDR